MSLPPKSPAFAASPIFPKFGSTSSASQFVNLRQSTPPPMQVSARTQRPSTSPVIGDLPLPVPVPTSARQTTPIKGIGSRTSTPTGKDARVHSQKRPNSAGRAGLALAQATFDAQRAHIYRHRSASAQISTRKLKRWERDNPILPRGDDEEENFLNMKFGGPSMSLTVDWRSLFSQLFQQSNWNSMQDFRSCAEFKGEHAASRTLRRFRQDDWAAAEAAWLKVEKKLRVAVQDTLAVKPETMFPFVQALEAILVYFSENLEAAPLHLIPVGLQTLLAEPLSVSCAVGKNRKRDADKRTDDQMGAEGAHTECAANVIKDKQSRGKMSLRINIRDGADAAFYRLFLHATSQFYGFKSHSINEQSARITLITPPSCITTTKTPMLVANVSLAAFLSILLAEATCPPLQAPLTVD